MQFGLRHLLSFITIVAVALALCALGPYGISLSIPYVLAVLGISLLYLYRNSDKCPEYLKLRYHAPLILLLFVATHASMPYFFQYGLWAPPINWLVSLTAVPLLGSLQIAKWHNTKLPHLGARITQTLYLWGLLMMRVLVLAAGSYIGP